MSAAPIDFPDDSAIPEHARVDAAPYDGRWLVGGEIRTWTGAMLDVLSCVCTRGKDGRLSRKVIGRLPALGPKEAMEALAAAKAAWDMGAGEWPTARPAERIAAVERFLDAMTKQRETVVRLLMWEIGKTRKDSESEFDRTVVYVRDTLEAVKELDRNGGRFAVEDGTIGQIRRSPLGVTLCMGPFNYPLNETFTTLIPALVMGNTIVAKLPKYGGFCQIPLLEAFRDAFPAGVVNVIQGDGATLIGPIMESGDVDCLAFIGSTRVSNILRRQHPKPNRLRCITGLGAKNPAFVLPDADVDVAVKECLAGSLSFNGQRCTAIKVIFAHESLADDFVARLAKKVDALKAGMPWDEGVQITPLPEDGKPAWLAGLVDDAVKKGAKLVNDGGSMNETFFRPAVVYPVTEGMELYRSEQFGPIVPIVRYRDEAELVSWVRTSPFGQQVSLFGREPARIAKLVDALVNQVSRINLNTQCRRGPDTFPFTGRRDAAEGTLSVSDALRAFSIRTLVATNTDPANKALVGEIVSRRLSSFLNTDFVF